MLRIQVYLVLGLFLEEANSLGSTHCSSCWSDQPIVKIVEI